jgi:crotonobetainyl-CoA:carnitine CoA-transferase CaiB-like acyl-CoA transferase
VLLQETRRWPVRPIPADCGSKWLPSGRFRERAPTLGERTDEILAELGYTPTQITAMREKGVV